MPKHFRILLLLLPALFLVACTNMGVVVDRNVVNFLPRDIAFEIIREHQRYPDNFCTITEIGFRRDDGTTLPFGDTQLVVEVVGLQKNLWIRVVENKLWPFTCNYYLDTSERDPVEEKKLITRVSTAFNSLGVKTE